MELLVSLLLFLKRLHTIQSIFFFAFFPSPNHKRDSHNTYFYLQRVKEGKFNSYPYI